MTAIVAYREKGKVYIGGDSAGVSGTYLVIRKDEKVFKKGNFIIGFTSSYRMGQILKYKLNVPEQEKNMSDIEYMSTVFIDSVRECLKLGGYSNISNNVEEGGNFIVGYKGEIYEIESDYQVGVPEPNFAACGCGGNFAKACLYTLKDNKDLTPTNKIQRALECAEYFSTGVQRPFIIIEEEQKL